jgi:putative transposase
MPTCISNQLIRKYQKNIKCKKVSKANLIVPACSTVKSPSVVFDKSKMVLTIKPLKLSLYWNPYRSFNKINQVEINDKFCFVTCTIDTLSSKKHNNFLGVDLNVKGNLATIGLPHIKKYKFLAKDALFHRVKYNNMRKRYQKQGRLTRVKQIGNKEQRIIRDINHKTSRKIVNFAKTYKCTIVMEKLNGIRNQGRNIKNKHFKGFLNSWTFYQLQQMVIYKAKEEGITVLLVDSKYTSQDCSFCNSRYKCRSCKREIHRDINASFNIANRALSKSHILEVY